MAWMTRHLLRPAVAALAFPATAAPVVDRTIACSLGRRHPAAGLRLAASGFEARRPSARLKAGAPARLLRPHRAQVPPPARYSPALLLGQFLAPAGWWWSGRS